MYHDNQSGKATVRSNRCWLYCMPGADINNQSLSPLHVMESLEFQNNTPLGYLPS